MFKLSVQNQEGFEVAAYFRNMKLNPFGRWIFALVSIGIILFCYWSFRAYLRTSSDPISLLPKDAQWVWVIQDWEAVRTAAHEEPAIPIYEKIISDMDIWSEWSLNYPDIQVILQQEKILWVSSDSTMKSGFWCFGLPDNWSSHRIEALCSRVPHLKHRDNGLIWSIDGEGLNYEYTVDDEERQRWKDSYQTIDHAIPMAILGKNRWCRFAMENRKGNWWGYVMAEQDVMGTVPLDTLIPLRFGEWCQAAYLRNIPNHQGDTTLKRNSGYFTMDTLCQCDAWQSMLEWQPGLGAIHLGENHAVSFTQQFEKNPVKAMNELYADTTSLIMQVQFPTFLQQAIFPELAMPWRWASKKSGYYTVGNDSVQMIQLAKDTSYFRDIHFEHSFPNHPVLLGVHRSAGISTVMPVDWTLVKGNRPYRVQVYYAEKNRWVVQLNTVSEPIK